MSYDKLVKLQVYNPITEHNTIENILFENNIQGILTFNYTPSKNTFKFNIDFQNAQFINDIVLKVEVSSKFQLSLLQIFIWKFKQNYFLPNKKIVFIIIQHDDKIANDKKKMEIPQFWQNLGGLTAHMGFEVQSVTFPQVFSYDKDIRVYHQSKFPSFSTLRIKSQNYQFSQMIKEDTILHQILLTIAALNFSIQEDKDEKKQFAHILPIIFALNAINLEKNIETQNQKEKLSKEMILKAQQIYNDLTTEIKENFVNVFHLPVHLMQLFYNKNNSEEQKINCLIEFQQMCDISYYNKVEYMCLVRNFYREENSVMSFSSRSGKSTTMYSLYYYDLFSQKQIPVYINLAHGADKQPLYNKTSFTFNSQKLIQQNMNTYEYFAYYYGQVQLVFKQINEFAVKLQHIQNRLNSYSIYYSDMPITLLFQELLNIDSFADKKIDVSQKQDENDNSNNYVHKSINLYVDECLSLQNLNYDFTVKKVLIATEKFKSQMYEVANSNILFVEIFKISIDDIEYDQNGVLIKKQKIDDWLKILSYRQNPSQLISQNAIPSNIEIVQYFKNEQDYIYSEAATQEQKQFLICNYCYIYKDQYFTNNAYNQIFNFLDNLIIESPQFPNIKKREEIIVYLFEKICRLSFDMFSLEISNIVFSFFMSLYNARGIETMFWKNIQYCLSLDNESLHMKKSFANNVGQYFGIDEAKNIKEPYIQIQKLHQYYKTNYTSYKNIVMVAGTDFSLINFVRQNQLCYNTESSRLSQLYIQSAIISPSQPHPQCLDHTYYQLSRVSISKEDILLGQVDASIGKLKFNQYYIHLIPEKASEIQILCALISPQILFFCKNSFLLHKFTKFQSRSCLYSQGKLINDITFNNQQMYQYNQIQNQIILQRDRSNVINLQQGGVTKSSFKTKDFHKNIIFISSSIYNKEIMFIFNFKLTQKFFNQSFEIDEIEQVLIDSLFKWSLLNECNIIILFILSLTKNKNLESFKKCLKNNKQQNLYLSLFTHDEQQFEEIQNSSGIWNDIQNSCEDMKFMFLQQSYDVFLQDDDQESLQNTKALYIEQSINLVKQCFEILVNHKQLTNNEPLAIITIIDKQLLKTKFAISDFMLAIISQEQNLLDINVFERKQFTVLNSTFYLFYIFLEIGVHDKLELKHKIKDSGIKSTFQLGFIKSQIQLNAHQFTQYSAMQSQIIQNYETKALNKFILKYDLSNFQTKQNKWLNTNVFQNYKFIDLHWFEDIIEQAILNNHDTRIVLFDMTQKTYVYLDCEVTAQSILNSLGDYVILNQEFEQKLQTIIFSVFNSKFQTKDNINDQQQFSKINHKESKQSSNILRLIKETQNSSVKSYAQKVLQILNNNQIKDTSYIEQCQNIEEQIQTTINQAQQNKLILIQIYDKEKFASYQYFCQFNIQSIYYHIKNYQVLNFQYQKQYQRLYFCVKAQSIVPHDFESKLYLIENWITDQQDSSKNQSQEIKHHLQRFQKISTKFQYEILQDVVVDFFKLDFSEQIQQLINNIIQDNQKITVEFFDLINKTSKIIQCEKTLSSILEQLDDFFILIYNYDKDFDVVTLSGVYNYDQIQKQTRPYQKFQTYDTYTHLHDWALLNGESKYLKLKNSNVVANYINIDLFQQQKSNQEQLKTFLNTIPKQQTSENLIKIALFNVTSQTYDYLDCDVNAQSILNSLGDFVILDQQFQQKLFTIIFSVARIEPKEIRGYYMNEAQLARKVTKIKELITYYETQEKNTSIVEENDKTPLQTIISWFSDYPKTHPDDYEIPHIKSYITAFKSDNLTEEVAGSANLELFAPGKTVDWQIQYIVGKAKDEAKKAAIKYKEEFNDNEIVILVRKIDSRKVQQEIPINSALADIISRLKGFQVLNYSYDADVDYGKLIFICLQNKE